MATLTSTLRLQLIDDVTRPAAAVAKAIKEDEERIKRLEAALKASGTTDRMQASLKKLGASASHIEGVTKAYKEFVTQEGIAGKAAAELSRDQINAIKGWESISTATVRAMIREEAALTAAAHRATETRIADMKREEGERVRKAIKAEEAAKREASAIARAAEQEQRAVQRALAAEERAREHALDLEKRQIAREEQMRLRHAEATRDRASFGHLAANTAATAFTAHSVVSGGEKVLEQGAHLQHERVLMGNAGITAGEIIKLQDEALRLSGIVRNVSQTQVMELGKEIRSVIADPKEVLHVLDPIVRAKSVLDAMDRSGASSAGIGQLVKAGEVLGAGQDPHRLAELIEGWVKAMQVMGKTINPEQIYEFAKYTKAAGAQLSDRFLMTVGPSVLQELGGSTTGNDIAMMSRQLTSGFANKHSALREMSRVGLIDPDAIDYLATGEAKGLKPGTSKAVKGESLFHTDPDRWVYEVLLPHLEAAGMKDKESQLAFVSKTFIGTAGDFISKLITQRQAFDTHAGLYGSAKGFKAIEENTKDASVGLDALTKSISNLSAQVSGPAMETIGRVLSGVANGINVISKAAAEHPNLAMTAGALAGAGGLAGSGYLAYNMMTGFGLPGAAGQLSAAALALDTAAAKLTAGSLARDAAPAALLAGGRFAPLLAGGLAVGTVAAMAFGAYKGSGIGKTDDQRTAMRDVARLDESIRTLEAVIGGKESRAEDVTGSQRKLEALKKEFADALMLLDKANADAERARAESAKTHESERPPVDARRIDELEAEQKRRREAIPGASDAEIASAFGNDVAAEIKRRIASEPPQKTPADVAKETLPGHADAKTLADPLFSPISFTRDSGALSALEGAVERGTYAGFKRLLDMRENEIGGGGGGGGIERASYTEGGSGGEDSTGTPRTSSSGSSHGGGRFNGLGGILRGDESVTVPGGTDLRGPADSTMDVPGAANPRLAGTRKAFFDELDRDPALRRDVLKTISMENRGSPQKLQAVLESMVNRARMNGYKSLRQAIHSGFYGPVNRGGLRGALSEKDRRDGEEAIKAVRGGSNIIGYRTDQGLLTDPGARRYMREPDKSGWKKVGGENYFFMGPKGRKWAKDQEEADRAAGVGGGRNAPAGSERNPLAVTPPSEVFGRKKLPAGQIDALNGSVGVDVSAIDHAISRLDVLHEKARAVRNVRIAVEHNMEDDRGSAPSMRHRLNGGYASDGRNWG